jgi:hypothetical protein
MPEKWVVVHVAPNRPVAEMVQDLLEQEGIEVLVRSPGLSPFIGVDLLVEILVSPEQEEKAREVLKAFSEGLPEDPGEDSPGSSPEDRPAEEDDGEGANP